MRFYQLCLRSYSWPTHLPVRGRGTGGLRGEVDALTASLETEQARVKELSSDLAVAKERGGRLDVDVAALRTELESTRAEAEKREEVSGAVRRGREPNSTVEKRTQRSKKALGGAGRGRAELMDGAVGSRSHTHAPRRGARARAGSAGVAAPHATHPTRGRSSSPAAPPPPPSRPRTSALL